MNDIAMNKICNTRHLASMFAMSHPFCVNTCILVQCSPSTCARLFSSGLIYRKYEYNIVKPVILNTWLDWTNINAFDLQTQEENLLYFIGPWSVQCLEPNLDITILATSLYSTVVYALPVRLDTVRWTKVEFYCKSYKEQYGTLSVGSN